MTRVELEHAVNRQGPVIPGERVARRTHELYPDGLGLGVLGAGRTSANKQDSGVRYRIPELYWQLR